MGKFVSLFSSKQSLKLFLIFVLSFTLLLSLVERTVGIYSGNILFLFDNARDLLYVQRIVIEHKLLLLGPSSGLQGYFHGVFWYYLLTIPFLLGHGNPVAITLFVAVLSSLSILLTFFTLKQTANIYAAILGSIIYSFAAFSVATAKFPWNPYPIVWLMPLYFWGLFKFMQKNPAGIYFVAFLTGLFIHFEAIYGVTLIPTFLILIIFTLRRKNPIKQSIQHLGISLVLFLIPFIPTLIFDVRHHFLITTNLVKTFVSGGSNITHNASEAPLASNIRFTLRTKDFYTYTFNTLTNNFYINLLYVISFFGSFLYLVIKKEKQKVFFICFCIVTLLSPLVVFLNLKYSVWSYYWIGNAPLYTLCFAYLIGSIISGTQNILIKITFIILCLLVIAYTNPFKSVPLWFRGELQPGSQTLSTQEQIVRTIYQDAKNKPFSVYVSTPPVYDYIYRYLFSWTARTQHIIAPADKKQHNIYTIIEFMVSDPGGNYFKHNTIHTQVNPVRTWNFPGVLIEKIIPSVKEKPVDPNYFPQL